GADRGGGDLPAPLEPAPPSRRHREPLPWIAPAAGARRLAQPVVQLGARGRRTAAVELGAQLRDRAAALGEHVVVVDGLQVDLPREDEVAVVEAGVTLERLLERDTDGVLDEARLQVGVL